MTIDQLARAHDRQFVLDVLGCKRANGFGNMSAAVAESLPFTSGAMLSAARHALKSGGAAAAPCAGFHHAEFGEAQGFCTFNGLMVTALALKKDGVKRIGILDLDMHYGNGTDDIINVRGAKELVRHFSGGAFFFSPIHVATFFERLPDVLVAMSDCDIVLYQAGADPHVDDPGDRRTAAG